MRRAIALSLLLAATLAAQGVSLHQAVITLDGRYNSIQRWEANFTQSFTSGLQTRTESGRLYLQKPGRMRWDYTDPIHKLFLVAGNRVWQYASGDGQATVIQVNQLRDLRTPLRFLLGHTNLEKELDDLSYSGLLPWQKGDTVLHGVPRQEVAAAGWRELFIEFTPQYRINRLLIVGLDGSQNDIRFSAIRVNLPLPKDIFKFTPPPGVRIVPGGR
ncbi:MAG: LolA family protein [Terriglobales bacterium]